MEDFGRFIGSKLGETVPNLVEIMLRHLERVSRPFPTVLAALGPCRVRKSLILVPNPLISDKVLSIPSTTVVALVVIFERFQSIRTPGAAPRDKL